MRFKLSSPWPSLLLQGSCPRRGRSLVAPTLLPGKSQILAAYATLALSIAQYDDLTVTVASKTAGFSRARIDRVRANDFTLKTQFSPQTVSIPFAEVRSLRWADPKHPGDPGANQRVGHAPQSAAARDGWPPPSQWTDVTPHRQLRDAGGLESGL